MSSLDKVSEVMRLRAKGHTFELIAKQLGVTRQAVHQLYYSSGRRTKALQKQASNLARRDLLKIIEISERTTESLRSRLAEIEMILKAFDATAGGGSGDDIP